MGWEFRNGARYYYRKERSAGRVRSVYVGRGEVANLTSMLDASRQAELKTARENERDERLELDALDRNIDGLNRLVAAVTEAVLITSGFHQHKRQWRRLKA